MHVATHHSLAELQSLAKARNSASLRIKLRAIVLARTGWTAPKIADAFGHGRRTVQRWIRVYNNSGLDGLKDRRGGNHKHLSTEQEQQLKAHLEALAADPRDGIRHAAEVGEWIEAHFNTTYSFSGLYALLHRLGYEWLMPRPRHPKADPEAREAFKKKRRSRCGTLPSNIPASASKCGSRMRCASDSRER